MDERPTIQKTIEWVVTNGRGYDAPKYSDAKKFPNARTEEDRLQVSLFHMPIDMALIDPPLFGDWRDRYHTANVEVLY